MTPSLFIAVTGITLTLVTGPVRCEVGNPTAKATYAGCYTETRNTTTGEITGREIAINADLPPADFKYVVLHEFAHAKYNNEPDVPTVFESTPKPYAWTEDAPREKMADWFTVFWNNLSWMKGTQGLAPFFSKWMLPY